MATNNETAVVIVGGGVAGLTLATFLNTANVPCIVLERTARHRIEVRARAGVVEARGVQMFERWGLADRLLGGPVAETIDYRINGVGRVFTAVADDGIASRFCTQQMLVNNLLKELIDVRGGDVRFEVADVAIRNKEGSRPHVSFTDAGGRHDIACDFIVGCDGSRGVSRSSIPDGVLTKYTHEYGYAWVAALVEAPVTGHPIMGVSDDGFVAQLPRGPQRSRYYLQCPVSDTPEDWPDERIWNEIRLRLRDDSIQNVIVHDRDITVLRSVVYAPMQHRNLFLAGDAAHLVPPTGAKGMNLALYDVDVLAQAFIKFVQNNDRTDLDAYSATVLPRLWKYQEFSAWMTDTMHDAGDPTLQGNVRQMMARARLDALFENPVAARLHGEYQRGTA
ncbi:4-hydroxybenzoate 3-monooxygenase [Nitrospirillum viridazoti Y2]|uniref:p-hydroxybenzoate 3-monooxygenase n=1 Tax=Nitrospirillum amazonense TaxID=28077 RepID=A0A560I1Z3_9PROT|nr:4-hydroxybenzoate 3-monooxygenase [Nitrospirillum amazonense]EGY01852.1 4-hydroxybenzoate 3-monooxygenase [Nitrospirillum amazonense Y2]TWB52918.1 p-hydroxybenzoate 3-monooxygenase [Nitrospirillum amazonense]